MSRRNGNTIISDNFDSRILFFVILATVFTNFIIRLKVLTNQLDFDMGIVPIRTNLFTYYKLIWIIFVTVIVLIAILYKLLKYKQKLNFNFALLGTSFIMIGTVLATLNSSLIGVHMWGLYSRTNGVLAYISLFLLMYLVSNFKVKVKHIDYLVHVINIASIILVIIGVFQFLGIDIMNAIWFKQIYIPSKYSSVMQSISIIQNKFRAVDYYAAPSIFGQNNYFGAFTSIIFPFITVFAINEYKLIKKTLLIIGSIMLYIGTILSYSSGSMIAMLIALIIIPIFVVNKNNYRSFLLMIIVYSVVSASINRITKWAAFSEIYDIFIRIINSKLIAIVAVGLIVYIILFIFRNKISKYRYLLVTIVIILVLLIVAIGYMHIINNVVENNMGMLTNRGYIWHYSYELIKDGYILGFGPDSLYYYFPQINTDGEVYLPNTFVDKPHNMYLQVLIDTGLIGLTGFMMLLVGLLLKSNKAIDFENDIYKNTYLKALMLVIAVYMIQGMVNDNHLTIQPVVYLLIGIGASLTKQVLDNAKLGAAKDKPIDGVTRQSKK